MVVHPTEPISWEGTSGAWADYTELGEEVPAHVIDACVIGAQRSVATARLL